MKSKPNFDVLSSPLLSGRTLIEASAGTGKTYTIAGIFLRLIVEQALGVEQILVTTYTELATAELRARVRRLLSETLAGLEGGEMDHELAKSFVPLLANDPDSRVRLRLALQTFDDAAIYTIHGFCQRMLQDRAFESRELFDAELVIDQSPILREIVDDFWRAHFYAGNPPMIASVLAGGLTPELLLEDLGELVNRPTAKVIPEQSATLIQVEEEFALALKNARSCWHERAGEIETIFQRVGWAKQPYNLCEKVTSHLSEISRIFAASSDECEWSQSLFFFAASAIAKGTRAHHSPPQHDFFDSCERLLAARGKLVVSLRATFLAQARAEMRRRKLEANVLSFDDLLLRLLDSLGERRGPQLAQSIRERFPAALIDEFQDTDPIQYAIFDQVFSGSDAAVFFIGDPKQAIYGFRGADIFTYLKAETKADRRYTLKKNWRSESALVDATNALFRTRDDPFLLPGIPFQPVEAAGKADQEPLTLNTETAPLLFSLVTQKDAMTTSEALRILPASVASSLVYLLNGNARIGRNQVRPRDLAVLVSTNDEARLVQEACVRREIPAVLYSTANVFQSREAQELALILTAVIEPSQENRVRAALASQALGLTSKGLETLRHDEQAWEERLLQFQRYHQLWQEEGFIQMLRTLFFENDVRSRLLRYPDGERRLTNMLHLTELLHSMCVEARLGLTGLLKRLSETMKTSNSLQNEKHEMRLERDENAVRVVTVHKSKGLEYGIVFCPFSWENPWQPRDNRTIFHDGEQLVLDLAGSEKNQATELDERRAEKLRLLYVAVTRAQRHVDLVWGNFKNGQDSALSYLLGNWPERGMTTLAGVPVIATRELPAVSEEKFLPAVTPPLTLSARTFTRELDRTYGIVSFTRLITGHSREPIAPEDDDVEATETAELAEESAQEISGIFAFPRGVRAGTCLHKIFEELDFSDSAALGELVKSKLRSFNITEQDTIVQEMVKRVLEVPLSLDDRSLTLSRVKPAAKLSELEFYFPVSHLRQQNLAELFKDSRLTFLPMSGFMKGFIDLVFAIDEKFYIADWKSNWLGPHLESYKQPALASEMESKFYHLQLNIYTLALDRFLRARLASYSYERDFGGVFYLFLRGVEPSRPELGVFRARPSESFISQLDRILTQ